MKKLDVFNDYWDWVWDAHFANKDWGRFLSLMNLTKKHNVF